MLNFVAFRVAKTGVGVGIIDKMTKFEKKSTNVSVCCPIYGRGINDIYFPNLCMNGTF